MGRGDGRGARADRPYWVDGALLLPDGRVLSWSADGTLRVWDVATGEGRALTGQGSVNGALLLPDGRVLSWSDDGTLRVWDVATGEGRRADWPRIGATARCCCRTGACCRGVPTDAAGVGRGDGRGAGAHRP